MPETLTDPLLGRVVDGRYEIRSHVASAEWRGLLAFDRRLEREVALKAMHQPLVDDEASREFVARFRREAKSSARLTHPGIVHVYDQGVDGELSYLTMEYVRGENLRARIAHEGTLTVGEALALTDAILDALAAAHRLGLVHRDVKPANVLIDTDGRARITDFGLARAVNESASAPDDGDHGQPRLPRSRAPLARRGDPATDVYAAGVMLFEMVTGRHPFTGESAIDIASAARARGRSRAVDLRSVAPYRVRRPRGRARRSRPLRAARRRRRSASARAVNPRTHGRPHARSAERIPQRHVAISADPDATTVLCTPRRAPPSPCRSGIGRRFEPVGAGTDLMIDDDPEALEPEASTASGLVCGLPPSGRRYRYRRVALWWYNAIGPGAFTTIPPVHRPDRGSSATRTLESAGFVVMPEARNDDAVPEGWAVGTEPGAQSAPRRAPEVTLIVSTGPRMNAFPRCRWAAQRRTRSTSSRTRVLRRRHQARYTDETPKGEVISSDPEAGDSVRHDTVVTLTVSDGPAPVTIPRRHGDDARGGSSGAEADGLVAAVDARAHRRGSEKGEVFKQDPAPDADGFRHGPVTIWVSDGPPWSRCPTCAECSSRTRDDPAESRDSRSTAPTSRGTSESCVHAESCAEVDGREGHDHHLSAH